MRKFILFSSSTPLFETKGDHCLISEVVETKGVRVFDKNGLQRERERVCNMK